MSRIRLASVEEPFASHPGAARAAMRLLARAEFSGALPVEVGDRLGTTLMARVLKRFSTLGVATQAQAMLSSSHTGEQYEKWLAVALEQTEDSPMPSGEWAPALETLGEDLLAKLLGISRSSLRRYASGDRRTPDDVAARLHFIALLLAELAGGYNDYGVRRWFGRERAALDGRRPADMLGAEFDPDGSEAAQLRALAEGMTAAGAT